MADLSDAVKAIQKAIRDNVEGLHDVPDMPPEKESRYPFVVSYPTVGVTEWRMQGHRIDQADIIIELHVNRSDLPVDIEFALGFHESVPAALKTAEIAGDLTPINTFSNLTWTFGSMKWNEIDTVGFRWTLEDVTFHQVG